MSLCRSCEDLPPGCEWVECPSCRITYSVDELQADLYRCAECGQSGLIPRSGQTVADRYPHPLGLSFTPIPNLFFEDVTLEIDGREVSIDAVDRAIIVALETHRRPGRDWVWPSQEKLAGQAGCAAKTVQRRLDALVAAGLLHREHRRGRRGRYEHTAYSLTPLWTALAHVAALSRYATTGLSVRWSASSANTIGLSDLDHRTLGPGPSDSLTHEEERPEEERTKKDLTARVPRGDRR